VAGNEAYDEMFFANSWSIYLVTGWKLWLAGFR